MRLVITLAIICLFNSIANSQCGETGFYPLPNDGIPEYLNSDNDGHLIVTVRDNNSSRIMKIDHARNILQQQFLGGSNDYAQIVDIAIDHDNNVYVCGSFQQSIDFGSGFSFSTSGGTTKSLFVAKLDHDLQPIWAEVSTNPTYSSGGGDDVAHSVTVDSLGGLYLMSEVNHDFQFQNADTLLSTAGELILLSKLNSNTGQMIWHSWQMSNNSSTPDLLQVSELGGVYEIVNFVANYTDQLGTTYYTGSPSYGVVNSLVIYHDSMGVQSWARHIEGGGYVKSCDINEFGDLALFGSIRDTLALASDTLFSPYETAMFYISLDTVGNTQEIERILTSNHTNHIVVGNSSLDYLENGEFLIAGCTNEQINFNGIVQSTTNPIDMTSFVARYDNNFTPIWSKTFGEGNYFGVEGVEELNDCSAYYFGRSWSYFNFEDSDSVDRPSEFIPVLIEFDLETGELADGQSGGGYGSVNDPFGPNGVQGSSASLNDELSGVRLIVYPNPSEDLLNVQFESPKAFEWTLIDSRGQLLKSGESLNTVKIGMSEFSSGLYLIRIDDGSSAITRKIIKK